ncbi:HTH domain-containing protein [Haloarcula salina]|uniref:Uncharacterized protein n=1 Tax=Haloarcula salina TaxID=1429914 RepID=A0AA41KJL4_9EURY|nr:HTH domain-containing protein [Haloarcula salina]MBV0900999.1 hypothetical protein [Haloarcula salina]
MPPDTYLPSVELYVRSLSPAGVSQQQDHVIGQLQALENDGRIADLSIYVWGDRLAPDTAHRTEHGEFLLDRLTAFERWERASGASLDAFGWRDSSTTIASDRTIDVISLPLMGLAEFVDGELRHVAPCTRDGTVQCVRDRVAALSAPTPSSEREAESERAPAVPGDR